MEPSGADAGELSARRVYSDKRLQRLCIAAPLITSVERPKWRLSPYTLHCSSVSVCVFLSWCTPSTQVKASPRRPFPRDFNCIAVNFKGPILCKIHLQEMQRQQATCFYSSKFRRAAYAVFNGFHFLRCLILLLSITTRFSTLKDQHCTDT